MEERKKQEAEAQSKGSDALEQTETAMAMEMKRRNKDDASGYQMVMLRRRAERGGSIWAEKRRAVVDVKARLMA